MKQASAVAHAFLVTWISAGSGKTSNRRLCRFTRARKAGFVRAKLHLRLLGVGDLLPCEGSGDTSNPRRAVFDVDTIEPQNMSMSVQSQGGIEALDEQQCIWFRRSGHCSRRFPRGRGPCFETGESLDHTREVALVPHRRVCYPYMPPLTPTILAGQKIRLLPLELLHHAALCEVGLDDRLWRLTTIQVTTPDEMSDYIRAAIEDQATGTALPFVVEELQSRKIIGCTRFHSYQEPNRRIEIGYTWLAVAWQRTGANVEAKLLMFRHAFEALGCVRVQFTADVDNTPSCRAIERLGAMHEGILRSYKISPRNGPRDLAIYSILATEWPTVCAALEERLSR